MDNIIPTNQWGQAQSFSNVCPSCGYCRHCGRGLQYTYPYYYNPYSNPYPWYVSNGTSTIQASIEVYNHS